MIPSFYNCEHLCRFGALEQSPLLSIIIHNYPALFTGVQYQETAPAIPKYNTSFDTVKVKLKLISSHCVCFNLCAYLVNIVIAKKKN